MSNFVLDNSVTMRWCFEDDSAYAVRVLERIHGGETAHVPVLWLYEVISVVAESQRANLLTPESGLAFLENLRFLPLEIDTVPGADSVFSRAFRLAVEYRLTGYDAIYLELAIRKGLPLASLDNDLNKAARRAGVTLLQP